MTDGQLTEDEHAARTAKAMSAKSFGELDAVVGDLQIPDNLVDAPVVRVDRRRPRRWLAPVAVIGAAAVLGAGRRDLREKPSGSLRQHDGNLHRRTPESLPTQPVIRSRILSCSAQGVSRGGSVCEVGQRCAALVVAVLFHRRGGPRSSCSVGQPSVSISQTAPSARSRTGGYSPEPQRFARGVSVEGADGMGRFRFSDVLQSSGLRPNRVGWFVADSRAAHKSSRSPSQRSSCARGRGMVSVRDSKNPTVPAPVSTPNEWSAFTAGVHTGEFDPS
ncbi:DUF397 domain-containing protein [Nocardia sp. CA-084685]|uniref:DUF397 domain-containing protein n=1 Tax=Nocardia sp. CA-084685 TaxID=3239970 RepID=UPI003D95DCDE